MSYILYTMPDGELRETAVAVSALEAQTIEEIAERIKPIGSTWQILADGEKTPELDAQNAAEVEEVATAAAKAAIVDSIATATITTTAGNVFKCDGKSQSDLTSVIVLAQIKGLTETEFKPKSSPTLMTLPLTELIEAGELIEAEIKTIMRGA